MLLSLIHSFWLSLSPSALPVSTMTCLLGLSHLPRPSVWQRAASSSFPPYLYQLRFYSQLSFLTPSSLTPFFSQFSVAFSPVFLLWAAKGQNWVVLLHCSFQLPHQSDRICHLSSFFCTELLSWLEHGLPTLTQHLANKSSVPQLPFLRTKSKKKKVSFFNTDPLLSHLSNYSLNQ